MHLKLLQKLQASEIPEKVLDVCKVLSANGHQALIVGGAVRDLLLDRPVTDWDVATCATPDTVMSIFPRTVPTGLQHGTVTVMQGDEGIEVTTFRKEMGHQDGRHPDTVEFLTDFREDLARRDFTINAMAFNPLTGDLFDLHHGLDDLLKRHIVAVGDANQRFREDGLRVMRAVRFAAQLGFEIEDNTFESITPNLDTLEKVSRERIRAELDKILASPEPSVGLKLLIWCDMWDVVFRGCTKVVSLRKFEALTQCDRLPNAQIRFMGLLRKMAQNPDCDRNAMLKGLVLSQVEAKHFEGVMREEVDELNSLSHSGPDLRFFASKLGMDVTRLAMCLLEWPQERRVQAWAELKGMPWTPKELKIRAGDLIQEGLATPGPMLGLRMKRLHIWALEDLSRNDVDRLLEKARLFERE